MNRGTLPVLLALAALTGCEQTSVTRVTAGDGRGAQSCIYGADGRTLEVRGGSVTSWSAGGGLVSAGRVFLDAVRESADRHLMPGMRQDLRIVESGLGLDGSARGMALVASEGIFSGT